MGGGDVINAGGEMVVSLRQAGTGTANVLIWSVSGESPAASHLLAGCVVDGNHLTIVRLIDYDGP